MSLSDPIADMLTRIRNALRIGRADVDIRGSKMCAGIAEVLKNEGYIVDYDVIDDGQQGIVKVHLKYDQGGGPVIDEIKRISKPGRRLYSSVSELPNVMGGLGIAIVSTSKGIMSDKKCRELSVGGEILCTVS